MPARLVTDAELTVALRDAGGIPSKAARLLTERLGFEVSRHLVWQRVDTNPVLQEVAGEADRALLDRAREGLAALIEAEDGPMTRWFLERKGKHLGFGNAIDLGLSSEAVDRIVAGLGGDLDKLRALRSKLGS